MRSEWRLHRLVRLHALRVRLVGYAVQNMLLPPEKSFELRSLPGGLFGLLERDHVRCLRHGGEIDLRGMRLWRRLFHLRSNMLDMRRPAAK